MSYVDDIVFCYRKREEERTKQLIREVRIKYEMEILGELKWFLGIHVLRDRRQRQLWLSQEAFIEKIANQYEIDLTGRLPDTPMSESELLPLPSTHTMTERALVMKYQRKLAPYCMRRSQRVWILPSLYHGWRGSIRTRPLNINKQQIE